jgi:anti-sigma B factor antagonist
VNGQLGLNVTHSDSQTVLTVTGDINMTTSPRMRAALIQAASEQPARLVVDLGGVTYIDSSGIATLVEALQRARREGRQLVLRGLRESIRAVFRLARLDEVFTIVH